MTLNHFLLIMQSTQNLEGLRKDMRQNAQGYKDVVAVGLPAGFRDLILLDCDQYDRRIGWNSALAANQSFLDALAEVGIDINAVTADVTELQNASTALRAGPLDTRAQINAAANALLLSVNAHVRLF